MPLFATLFFGKKGLLELDLVVEYIEFMQSIILFGIKCQAVCDFESSLSDTNVNEHSMKIEILLF